MSDVEKKVVKVEFDNSKFDKNVKKSSNTLNDFKEKLQFKDVSKSFDAVVKKITALDVITASVINNITNKVVNLGLQLVKSLSVDNISSGWDKFGLKTTSVATIAAQSIKIAGKELINYEDKLAAINDQLDKLNWFTDETSYNFTDMVNTIGKFTAAGQDLDKSVNAMIGIANWAALSGQNATVASRAMYNLAQAMSKGNVQLIDWRSIETANMATIEFKNTVLETAAAMGELTKQGDTFISKTGKKITALNFAETLSDKWFTSDILVATLEKYSAAVERIYEIANETGYTASEVMARYSDELDKFGLKAFRAAQEARTFADALNSVKDAVSTGWLNTFEKIFGGYDESRKLWTDLANELYNVFAEGGNFRNQILGIWKDLGGRADLFEHGDGKQGAFWNIYDSIVALINKFKEARDEIFAVSIFQDMDDQAKDLGRQLKNITDRIQIFTEKIKKAVEENTYFKGILTGVFAILKTIGQVIRGIRYALDPIINLITGVFSDLLDRIGVFGSNLKILERTFKTIENISRAINALLTAVLNILDIRGTLNKFFDFIGSIFSGSFNVKSITNNVVDFFNNIGDAISNFKRDISSIVSGNYDDKDPFAPLYSLIKGIANFVKGVWSLVSSVSTIIGKAFELVGEVLKSIANFIDSIAKNNFDWKRLDVIQKIIVIATAIAAVLALLYLAFEAINAVFTPFTYMMETLAESLYNYSKSKTLQAVSSLILSIGESLMMVGIGLALIGSLDTESYKRAAAVMLVLLVFIVAIMGILYLMNKKTDALVGQLSKWQENLKKFKDSIGGAINEIKKSFKFADLAAFISSIGLSLIGIGIAFKIIGSLDEDQYQRALTATVIILGSITLMVYALEGMNKNLDSKEIKKIAKTLLVFSIAFKLLASIIISFSKIDQNSLFTSVLAISAMMIVVGLFVDSLKSTKIGSYNDDKNLSKTFLSITILISSLLGSILLLKDIPAETLFTIIGAITSLLAVLDLFFFLLPSLDKFASQVPSSNGITKILPIIMILGAISTLLLSFALSFQLLGKVSVGQILVFAIAFLGVFAVFGLMILTLEKMKVGLNNALNILILLGGFATLLLSFAASLSLLKDVPIETILASVLALNLLMLGFSGMLAILKALNLSEETLYSFGAALLSFSASMLVLAGALLIFAKVDWQSIGKIAAVAAGGIVLLVGAAFLIKKGNMDEAIVSLAAAFLMFGAALLLIGASMKVISESLAPFVKSIGDSFNVLIDTFEVMNQTLKERSDSITDFFKTLGDVMLTLFLDMFNHIVDAVVAMTKKLADALKEMKDPIISIILDLYDIIIQTLPKLLEIIGIVIQWVLDFITDPDNIQKVVTGFMTFLVTVIENLAQNAGIIAAKLTTFLIDFIISALSTLAKDMGRIVDSLLNIVIELIYGLSAALIENAVEVGKALGTLIYALIGAFIEMILGLFAAFFAWAPDIQKAILGWGDSIKETFQDALGIHSPSKMTAEMGKYLMQGFVVGMNDEKAKTVNESSRIMTDCVNSAIETAQDIIDDDMDDALVIRPVMDLSNVTAGANSIAGIMSGVGSTSVTADIASKTSREIDRNQNQNGVSAAASTTVNNAGDTYNNVFNITTNDPEELAREVDEIMQRKHTKYTLAKGGAR